MSSLPPLLSSPSVCIVAASPPLPAVSAAAVGGGAGASLNSTSSTTSSTTTSDFLPSHLPSAAVVVHAHQHQEAFPSLSPLNLSSLSSSSSASSSSAASASSSSSSLAALEHMPSAMASASAPTAALVGKADNKKTAALSVSNSSSSHVSRRASMPASSRFGSMLSKKSQQQQQQQQQQPGGTSAQQQHATDVDTQPLAQPAAGGAAALKVHTRSPLLRNNSVDEDPEPGALVRGKKSLSEETLYFNRLSPASARAMSPGWASNSPRTSRLSIADEPAVSPSPPQMRRMELARFKSLESVHEAA